MTQILCMKCKHCCQSIYIQIIRILRNYVTFQMVVRASTKTIKFLLICAITKKTLTTMRSGFSWRLPMESLHVMVSVDLLRGMLQKEACRDHNNKILNNIPFLKLCKAEIKHITFVGIDKLHMAEVRLRVVTPYQAPEAIIILLLTQHLKFPINLPVNTKHVVNLILILQYSQHISPNFRFRHYVSCFYDNYWWIGLITEVNEEYQDIKIYFLHPHGPRKAFAFAP